ncbi:MAG: neutral zinc metallopeptidase [Bacteroidaceae bacterium]|nr:neutral zinc metallopeptidase [Bacteroidaceae bacterium]
MRLDGRRESSNVDDRRTLSGGAKAGMGIGGLVIVALITWFMGGNPLSVLSNADLGSMITTGDGTQREMTAEEEELAKFSRQILASTEDVWTRVFKQYGKTYQAPTMVLFTNAVKSGCGQATASVGPFYCSADQCLYIDLSFFSSMKRQLGADGDFAYAYVIAHEVGHHVQYLLGTLDSAHNQMARMSEAQSNRVSVRIELQADYYAGVWGYYENRLFNSLEQGDLEEAINCSLVIGDDYLQKKAQGYTVPESFNHGTSEQRRRWLTKGLTTGDMTQANTFELSDSQL